jgi:succinyl-diaminopimelate desuccinylase
MLMMNGHNEERVVEICRELIRIKSVNPPGDERSIAEYVSQVLKEARLSVELLCHDANRASVLARIPSSRKRPALLFAGHLDTVPIGTEKWARDPFSAIVAEGKIWGRGAADMKGGVAAMIMAAINTRASGRELNGDLILAATAGEEVDSLGAEEISKRTDLGPIAAIIVPEPSDNKICLAHKGALWVEVTTFGRTAHGSMPEEGINAINAMLTVLGEIRKMKIPARRHRLLGPSTASINTLRGGEKTNVVPDYCTATVDMRTLPGQDHRHLLQKVMGILEELKVKVPHFRASLKVLNDRGPIETKAGERVARVVDKVVQGIADKKFPATGVSYYTDASVFVPALKAPMVICGPGIDTLAHKPNEYIAVESLLQAVRIYEGIIRKFL